MGNRIQLCCGRCVCVCWCEHVQECVCVCVCVCRSRVRVDLFRVSLTATSLFHRAFLIAAHTNSRGYAAVPRSLSSRTHVSHLIMKSQKSKENRFCNSELFESSVTRLTAAVDTAHGRFLARCSRCPVSIKQQETARMLKRKKCLK